MESLEQFLNKIRTTLENSVFNQDTDCYPDLSNIRNPVSTEDLTSPVTPQDCLVSFQEIIVNEITKCNSDKIKIGINELLKHLLTTITPEQEHYLSERYLYRLRMIFKRCLMPDFPFPEEIWNYICDCLRSVGAYLVENDYYIAAQEIIDSLAQMGRIAALKGMPTANTQSSLRLIENEALARDQKRLASVAKNARFNLET
ncbi:MAG TPA: hypothetical protein VNT57_02815 [Desulfobacteria bacterium]|nr:hypothetical protein [Desulfobacteria bacterium]